MLDITDDKEPDRERTRAREACVAGEAGIEGACEALELELPTAVTIAGVAAAVELAAGISLGSALLDDMPVAGFVCALLCSAAVAVDSSNRCAAAVRG